MGHGYGVLQLHLRLDPCYTLPRIEHSWADLKVCGCFDNYEDEPSKANLEERTFLNREAEPSKADLEMRAFPNNEVKLSKADLELRRFFGSEAA
jgi:hypothetical protein